MVEGTTEGATETTEIGLNDQKDVDHVGCVGRVEAEFTDLRYRERERRFYNLTQRR